MLGIILYKVLFCQKVFAAPFGKDVENPHLNCYSRPPEQPHRLALSKLVSPQDALRQKPEAGSRIPDGSNDPDLKIIKTEHAKLTINDKPGQTKIEIKTDRNQLLTIKPDSIEIFHDGCSIKLTSSKISINGTNLEVLK